MRDPAKLPQMAGILCNDEGFQTFAGARTIRPGLRVTASATAEFLRRECGITSRRELATNPNAARKFDQLRTEYDAFRGKIAKPR